MFIHENSTLYLDNWNYNSYLIIEALKEIILSNNGHIKPTTGGYIVKRSLLSEIEKTKKEIIDAEKIENSGIREKILNNRKRELAELEAIPNDPRPVSGSNYITFILDNTYYYLQLDDNPFFEFYYTKTPINETGTYNKDTYLQEIDKNFVFDCFFSTTKPATDADRHEAANILFNNLITAKNSKIYRERGKSARIEKVNF